MNNVDCHPNQYPTDYGHIMACSAGYLKLEEDDAQETEEIEKLKDKQRKDKERAREQPGTNSQPARTIWQEIREIVQDVPDEEWARLPRDGSANLDHYLYGDPKE